ncbi:uncharacterized protein LOC143294960 [Babylonia areolata]|uniref:uncharacterized protein LOC143294960 n=1 Tax=Babylonia areolata TaxID=304850 RepID=UPI003FD39E0A
MMEVSSQSAPLFVSLDGITMGPSSMLCSDSTTGTQDLYEPLSPLSPDFSLNMRADISWQASSPEEDRIDGYQDNVQFISSTKVECDLEFYRSLAVGSHEAVIQHRDYIENKFDAGLYPLPTKGCVDPTSETPYSDIAKPKKKGKAGCVKRPMNAFMGFAQGERQTFMSVKSTMDNAAISKHLGCVWKLLGEKIKTPFKEYAALLKELHKAEFPDYKYRPQKKKSAAAPSSSPSATSSSRKASNPRGRARKAKPYDRQPDQDVASPDCNSQTAAMVALRGMDIAAAAATDLQLSGSMTHAPLGVPSPQQQELVLRMDFSPSSIKQEPVALSPEAPQAHSPAAAHQAPVVRAATVPSPTTPVMQDPSPPPAVPGSVVGVVGVVGVAVSDLQDPSPSSSHVLPGPVLAVDSWRSSLLDGLPLPNSAVNSDATDMLPFPIQLDSESTIHLDGFEQLLQEPGFLDTLELKEEELDTYL